MAKQVKASVAAREARKSAAAKKKRYSDIKKRAGQAKPLSKETKRHSAPKKASDQSKASMKRHVIGATRAKARKKFPELKTKGTSKAMHELDPDFMHPEVFKERTGRSRGSLLTAPGRYAAKKSKARYGTRKKGGAK